MVALPLRGVERVPPFPPWNPVQIGATPKEVLRRTLLPAVTCRPERAADALARQSLLGPLFLDAVRQSKRRSLPQGRSCPSLHESSCSFPLAEADGVAQRRSAADDRTGCLDIRAGIKQRVEHLDVIAACGPVQRGFGMRANQPGIDVGASRNQYGNDFGAARMAGPIGRHMQQRSRRWAVADARAGQGRMLRQQIRERFNVAALDRLNDGDRQWMLQVELHYAADVTPATVIAWDGDTPFLDRRAHGRAWRSGEAPVPHRSRWRAGSRRLPGRNPQDDVGAINFVGTTAVTRLFGAPAGRYAISTVLVGLPAIAAGGYLAAWIRPGAATVLAALVMIAAVIFMARPSDAAPLWYQLTFLVLGPLAAQAGAALRAMHHGGRSGPAGRKERR